MTFFSPAIFLQGFSIDKVKIWLYNKFVKKITIERTPTKCKDSYLTKHPTMAKAQLPL